jgi:hypothetical protein
MKFNCPNCRKEYDFMAIRLSADLNAIIAMLGTFGRHHAVVWAYAELFGVVPFHAKAKKLRLILEELKKLFDGAGFSYQRRLYRISQEGIAEALNVVVKKNFAGGLDSHNYLKRVMISIAEREDKDTGRRTEKDLRKKEASLMSGSRDGGERGRDAEARRDRIMSPEAYPIQEEQVEAPRMKTMPRTAPLTDAELEVNRQRLKKMAETIG